MKNNFSSHTVIHDRYGFNLSKTADGEFAQSATIQSAFPFDCAILSANFSKTVRSALLELAISSDGKVWSRWYKMGQFRANGMSESFPGQEDSAAKVDVDILRLKTPARLAKYRITAEGRKDCIRLAALNFCGAAKPSRQARITAKKISATKLNVPLRSQMTEKSPDAKRICSATALGMILEFYGAKFSTLQVARKVKDTKENIYGNWVFNMAWASTLGYTAFIDRLYSLEEAAREIAEKRPVIASISFTEKELTGSPIPKSAGHLVVIIGFDNAGNVIVNDSAGKSAKEVRRTYKRKDFEKVWLGNKQGLIYRIIPKQDLSYRIKVPLAPFTTKPEPAYNKENLLETQLACGEEIKILKTSGNWAKAVCPGRQYYFDRNKKGMRPAPLKPAWTAYPGWIHLKDITPSVNFYPYALVKAAKALFSCSGRKDYLYMGTPLHPLTMSAPWTEILLPNGEIGVSDGKIIGAPKKAGHADRKNLVQQARKFLGRKYLLGGITLDGIDCSGFAGLIYKVFAGITLPRNAHDQFLFCRKISLAQLKPGDLIFRSNGKRPDFINHVMIYCGGEKIIEATEETMSVREVSFSEKFGRTLANLGKGEIKDGGKVFFGSAL